MVAVAVRPVIGVLALQGAFAKHQESLERLGVEAVQVRTPEQLNACEALVIPGGESTTLFKLLDFSKLTAPLREFAREKPILGTCAGLILMARSILGQEAPAPFAFIDVTVARNAYGRQLESFAVDLPIKFSEGHRDVHSLFIRAPRIVDHGPEVEVLAEWEGSPVLVRQGKHMAASFHPELTAHTDIHEEFLKNLTLQAH